MNNTPAVVTELALSFRSQLRDCTKCELHEVAKAPVPWRGEIGSKFCILGEAPGATENTTGRPFDGPAGNRMGVLLKRVGINPDECSWMNTVACYPKGTPTLRHVQACQPWKHGQLEFLRPQYIIPVGNTALVGLIGRYPKLRDIHGKPLRYDVPTLEGIKIWPTNHPAATLYPGGKKYEKAIVQDLHDLMRWIENDEPWPEDCYLCGEELYRYDGWGIGYCYRHAQRQGMLFPEDEFL